METKLIASPCQVALGREVILVYRNFIQYPTKRFFIRLRWIQNDTRTRPGLLLEGIPQPFRFGHHSEESANWRTTKNLLSLRAKLHLGRKSFWFTETSFGTQRKDSSSASGGFNDTRTGPRLLLEGIPQPFRFGRHSGESADRRTTKNLLSLCEDLRLNSGKSNLKRRESITSKKSQPFTAQWQIYPA